MPKQPARLILILLLMPLIVACCPPTLRRDIDQQRLDAALPPLGADHIAGQSFVSRQPNLSSLEFLLVRYQPEKTRPEGTSQLLLRLKEHASDAQDLITQVADTGGYEHNSSVVFSFEPQPNSRDKRYFLFLEGVAGDDLSVWYSSENAYGQGELLLDGVVQTGDLRFTTQYAYGLPLALEDLRTALSQYAWPIVLALALLLIPGWFVRTLLGLPPRRDPFTELAEIVAMSLAVMPLLLLWTTTAGIRLSRWVAVYGLPLLAGAAGWMTLRRGVSKVRRSFGREERLPWCTGVAMFALLLAVRFLQISDAVLPLWVDSLHHTMITRLIAEQGMIPATYEPYVPVASNIYHFGFHADAAFYRWVSNLPSERVLLVFGQVLNALASAAAYLLAVRFSRSRLAGLCAFVVVGFVSVMPAYYVSWGRYTQLTGLIILPGLMVALADGVEATKDRWRWVIGATILMAGLILTHYRVAIIAACFALVWIGGVLWRRRRNVAAVGDAALRVGCVATGALLLTLPWTRGFVEAFVVPFGPLLPRLEAGEEVRDVPWQLLSSGHDRLLIALALVGAALGVSKRKRGTTALLLWIALLFLVVNPHLLGLPDTWLITNFSIAIALFLPVSAFIGYLCSEMARLLRTLLARLPNLHRGTANRRTWSGLRGSLRRLWVDNPRLTGRTLRIYRALVLGVAFASASCGGWDSLDVVNPATVLATEEDLRAMEWIRENVASDAMFLINSIWWQYDMRMGTDAGWWIPLLTGRRTTLPPVLYSMADPDYVAAVNSIGQTVEDSETLNDPSLRETLDQLGVTHVYVGAKGGHLTPQMLLASDGFQPVYSSGEVWVFARGP